MNVEILTNDDRKIFDLLDELRVLGIGDDLPIPQIAVIGDQSSGKSSLLEALSGIPFPRGVGLVTRCPTCISMHKSLTAEENEWTAEISVTDSRLRSSTGSTVSNLREDIKGIGKVLKPLDLADRISMIMDQLVKESSNDFSTETIMIRIEAPNITDLTIIDLPGIIRTTTAGQSQAVISQVDNMLQYYMKQSRTIILAVIPANQDIATIDVLERAQKLDPMGARTIGVLTKLDLVDEGAEHETLDIINNKKKPLALGYVAVKNRSQIQIKEYVSLEVALLEEENYFNKHNVWKSISVDNKGILALRKRLTSVLFDLTTKSLPDMKKEIVKKLNVVNQDLSQLGEPPVVDDVDGRKQCLNLLSHFGILLRQLSGGVYHDPIAQNDVHLRIKYRLERIQKQLRDDISGEIPNYDDEEYSNRIQNRLMDMRGRELSGFISSRLLLSTVATDIEGWRIEVEKAFAVSVETFASVANRLAHVMAPHLPRFCHAVTEIVDRICLQQSRLITQRSEEMFHESSIDALTNDKELIPRINQIRYARFEEALKDVLATSLGSQEETETKSKQDLKEHLLETMGIKYMQIHGVGCGPYVPKEDSRAVLHAYWAMAEKRMIDSASQAIEHVLLVNGSQAIETAVLEFGQKLCNENRTSKSSSIEIDTNGNDGMLNSTEVEQQDKMSLAYIFAENIEHAKRRNQLKSLKLSLETALLRIENVCLHNM